MIVVIEIIDDRSKVFISFTREDPFHFFCKLLYNLTSHNKKTITASKKKSFHPSIKIAAVRDLETHRSQSNAKHLSFSPNSV